MTDDYRAIAGSACPNCGAAIESFDVAHPDVDRFYARPCGDRLTFRECLDVTADAKGRRDA